MLNIYDVLNIELKMIYEYNLYRKNMAAECVFSGRDNYSRKRWCVGLKDVIEEMFNEKILRIYKFSCDDFSMIFYFCLVNKKCLQNRFFIIRS